MNEIYNVTNQYCSSCSLITDVKYDQKKKTFLLLLCLSSIAIERNKSSEVQKKNSRYTFRLEVLVVLKNVCFNGSIK